jgi:hypothetical protein
MREELETLLAKLEDIELELVEKGIIQDGDRLSDVLGVIKGKIMDGKIMDEWNDEWNKK